MCTSDKTPLWIELPLVHLFSIVLVLGVMSSLSGSASSCPDQLGEHVGL